jgi:hypothetical protein
LAERAATEKGTQMIKCGHCQGGHATVAEVRRCAVNEPIERAFKKMLQDKAFQKHQDELPSEREQEAWAFLTAQSDAHTEAVKQGRLNDPRPTVRPARTSTAVLDIPVIVSEDGMYCIRVANQADGVRMDKTGQSWRIFKVQRAVHGSGRLYAKELHPDADGSWTFKYAPGALNLLAATDKMTREQAKKFGALYGTCVRCGRTLTREDSIDRMMGAVCSSKF